MLIFLFVFQYFHLAPPFKFLNSVKKSKLNAGSNFRRVHWLLSLSGITRRYWSASSSFISEWRHEKRRTEVLLQSSWCEGWEDFRCYAHLWICARAPELWDGREWGELQSWRRDQFWPTETLVVSWPLRRVGVYLRVPNDASWFAPKPEPL